MTVPERLNARPPAIRPCPCRTSARSAEVRSNSDNDRDNARPKLHNKSAFSHATGVRALRTFAPRTCGTLQTIWCRLKSHR
jgi:hypothetical protein